MSNKKNFFINGLLIVFSLSLLLLFLEFVIFRFILIAPDMPELDFVDGVVKYKPNQQGIYRVKNEIKAVYKINANGWNSIHAQYNIENPVNKYRTAIIGDSFVEGFVVNYDEGIDKGLENKLGKGQFEVYRFGISGAPMSQYLHILRKEVIKYQPDLVVVVLVHNDFDESYRYLRGTYASNFMKLKIDGDDVFEAPPTRFQRLWYTPIRGTAMWRYLAYRQQIPYHYLKDLLFGNKREYQANIAIDSIEGKKLKNEIATNYIFKKMKEFCDKRGIELLIIIDGDRKAIYDNINMDELYKTGALSLNLIAKKAAQQNGISFIDLHPVFGADFKKNQKRFDFKSDGHWDTYGYEVVADVIYRYIKDHQFRLLRAVGQS